MTTVPVGAHHRVHDGPLAWARQFIVRVGHHWAENPWVLATFAVRLLRAWRYLLVDLTPRELGHTLWRFIRQTGRTFTRGVFVVLGLGLALGFGTGAVARAVGPLLQPVFASVIVTVLLRDAAPLVLTLFLAGRMGGSIAAKLGSADDPALGGSPYVTDRELTRIALPHLVAGTITAALFYSLGAYCIVRGYLRLGDPRRIADADAGWFLRLEPIQSALWFGVVKSMAFGGLVSFAASAFGIAARERALRGARRVDDVQNAVWETSVASILIATALSVLLWLALEPQLA
jgi:ABC-type transporter Mla maintaining outer membrane lipid asymmetry permease subunit MlaE